VLPGVTLANSASDAVAPCTCVALEVALGYEMDRAPPAVWPLQILRVPLLTIGAALLRVLLGRERRRGGHQGAGGPRFVPPPCRTVLHRDWGPDRQQSQAALVAPGSPRTTHSTI
jgi:hypothetical protein